MEYSPRGETAIDQQSKQIVNLIKRDSFLPDQRQCIHAAITKLASLREEGLPDGFAEILNPDSLLVPVPRSVPFKSKDSHWPSRTICEQLVENDFGATMAIVLSRKTPVQKAAVAKSDGRSRPTVADHIESLECDGILPFGRSLVVVDDVITSGTQLHAAATVVSRSFPDMPMSAFALVRTRSDSSINDIVMPYSAYIYCTDCSYAWRK